MGGNIPGGSFLDRNFLGGNSPESSFTGGNFLGGSFPDTCNKWWKTHQSFEKENCISAIEETNE